ncbi:MAG TPA: hypothetical protein VFE37_24840 [Chloroflexota bacterium]|nr:hypothetical protein [Chloroflexota bacterium]
MSDEARARYDVSTQILTMSVTLTGTCLAGCAIVRVEQATVGPLLADNLLAAAAFGYLIASGLAYWAVRQRNLRCHRAAEWSFLVSSVLLGLILLGFVVDKF